MTLKEHYDSLEPRKTPKQELIEKICIACKVSKRQALRYINGDTVPSPADQEAISKITEIPVCELYVNEEAI